MFDVTLDQWYAEVLRICKEREYSEWFYADREAWLDLSNNHTPLQAVDYNYECLF